MRIKGMVIAGILLLGQPHAAVALDSLCEPTETIYFACSVASGKLVSLCGSAYIKALSANQWSEPENPWLQYRFGLPEKIELVYPHRRVDSLSKFYGEIFRAQGGSVGSDSVLFMSKGIAYKLAFTFPYEGDSYYDVTVGDPKELGFNIQTKHKTTYPRAQLRCLGEVEAKKFNELVRFLFDQHDVSAPR